MNKFNTQENVYLKNQKAGLPDITTDSEANLNYTIDQVGMNAMEMIARIKTKNAVGLTLPAKVDVYVSLDDKHSKGIHMSRLYAVTYKFLKEEWTDPRMMERVLDELIDSQKGISSAAYLTIKFDYLLEQPSLVSNTTGMRHYPITMHIEKRLNEPAIFKLELTLTYSSTCPCSTALSEQFISDQLNQSLGKEPVLDKATIIDWIKRQNIISAVPHSQRSYANIGLTFANVPQVFVLEDMITNVEKVIKTSVQTSVKREDEQNFAIINAKNLMFCEDAARILKDFYIKDPLLKQFTIKVSHHESLHAHNAVAIVNHPS